MAHLQRRHGQFLGSGSGIRNELEIMEDVNECIRDGEALVLTLYLRPDCIPFAHDIYHHKAFAELIEPCHELFELRPALARRLSGLGEQLRQAGLVVEDVDPKGKWVLGREMVLNRFAELLRGKMTTLDALRHQLWRELSLITVYHASKSLLGDLLTMSATHEVAGGGLDPGTHVLLRLQLLDFLPQSSDLFR